MVHKMNGNNISLGRAQESILATNKILKNTYLLLSMTLIFSGVLAAVGMSMNLGHGAALVANIAAIALMWFVLPRTANSSTGIPVLFAITGLFGLGLGPILNHYMAINPSIVTTALGGTGVIFLGLSGYALTTRKDFSFMGGFLMVGMMVVIGASLLNIFMQMPLLSLVSSAAVIMLMSGFILYETSSMIHNGETNYIMAAASLFLSILNMFQALLHILGAFGSDD
jgi:modulator of FtsH protease